MEDSMRRVWLPVALAAAVVVAGCTMSETGQRTTTGALGGAAGGAIIGAIAGNAALGAGIGAAAGAAGGFLWDQHKKSEAAAYQSGYQAGKASQ
jgi:uncharacterized membrane protein